MGYWGCYGAAAPFGRKAEDLEPGRCRRTDGKKWRCSREAHDDSKYCEKHIHHGKSRSRKPVDQALASSEISPAAAAAGYRPSALSISPPRAPDAAAPGFGGHHQQQPQHGASSARAPAHQAAAGAPLQLHLDASLHAASPPPSYHRYAHAHYAPPPLFPGGYGHVHAQAKELQDAELRRRHYLALGADLSLDKPPAAAGQDAAAATEKPLRRFFDDWPREGGDARPWTVGAEDATQLSISIPAASPSDLAVARYRSGESPSKRIPF